MVIPNFACLKSKIIHMQNLEKYIAMKNETLEKHKIKCKHFWSTWDLEK